MSSFFTSIPEKIQVIANFCTVIATLTGLIFYFAKKNKIKSFLEYYLNRSIISSLNEIRDQLVIIRETDIIEKKSYGSSIIIPQNNEKVNKAFYTIKGLIRGNSHLIRHDKEHKMIVQIDEYLEKIDKMDIDKLEVSAYLNSKIKELDNSYFNKIIEVGSK